MQSGEMRAQASIFAGRLRVGLAIPRLWSPLTKTTSLRWTPPRQAVLCLSARSVARSIIVNVAACAGVRFARCGQPSSRVRHSLRCVTPSCPSQAGFLIRFLCVCFFPAVTVRRRVRPRQRFHFGHLSFEMPTNPRALRALLVVSFEGRGLWR